MDTAVFLSIAGVIVGWLLSELSGAFRTAREERQCLKSAIPPLVRLYFEQYRINEILTSLNVRMGDDFERGLKEAQKQGADASSIRGFLDNYISQYDDARKITIAVPQRTADHLADSFRTMMDALSRVDPVSAYSAGKLYSEFILFQESELPSATGDPSAYAKTLEIMLGIYRQDMNALRSLILAIACKAGIIQYFKVRSLLKQEESELMGGFEKAHGKIFSNAA